MVRELFELLMKHKALPASVYHKAGRESFDIQVLINTILFHAAIQSAIRGCVPYLPGRPCPGRRCHPAFPIQTANRNEVYANDLNDSDRAIIGVDGV